MLSKTIGIVAAGLVAVASLTSGHPGEVHHPMPRAELNRRQLEANKRHVVARNCAPQIAEFNAKRKAKRAALAKRNAEPLLNGRHFRRDQHHGGQQQQQNQPQPQQLGHAQQQQQQNAPSSSANEHSTLSHSHGHSASRYSGSGVCSTRSASGSSATGVVAAVTGTTTVVTATAVSSSSSIVGTSTSTADAPTYTTLQNSTCVTAPEVTEGPYYVANELLRTDLRETQSGVDLLLDIGIMDVSTCQPLEQALVEIWACNATGQYSGFSSLSSGGTGGGNGTMNGTEAMTMSLPTDTASMSMPLTNVTGSGSAGAAPTGGAGGGSGMASTSMTDQDTFLRGGAATGPGGVVEFKTIYPGFYTGRTVHIHTMVQTNYTVATNGSIISHAGQVHHVGQIFFDEAMNTQVLAQPAYVNTTQVRTVNDDDSILAEENADGFNAYADASLIGEDVSDGVLAYITIGVDLSFVGSIVTTNYRTVTSDELTATSTASA